MTTIDTTTVNGFTVELHYDEDSESPRDWTHGAELVLAHKRYSFPNDAGISFDDFDSISEIRDYLLSEGALATLPVYMYEHGGIALSVGEAFSDPWDSGVLGLAYVTPQNWKDTQGDVEWTGSDDQLATAAALMKGDVATYGQYLNGEVYGYVIIDPVDGEVVASLWGMYGYEYAEQEAADAANALTHEPKCSGRLDHRSGTIKHDGPCAIHDRKQATRECPASGIPE